MVYIYDLDFTPDNGARYKGRDFGLVMEKYPDIPAAVKVYNKYQIPGRAGELIQDTKTKQNIVITCELTVLEKPKDQLEYRDYIRNINRWLNGSGWVQFSDEQDTRYRVLTTQVQVSERITPIYGKISVQFTIEPYEYVNSGFIEHNIRDFTFNGYDLCKPLYLIEGNSEGTITVNGVQFQIRSIERLTIDSALMLAWSTADGVVKNQAVAGDYEDLWLPYGDNTITATPGLTVKIQPRWGWEL